MKRGIMFSMAALGLIAANAEAGQLSMRFAGGATEVTMGVSDSVTVEVLFQMNASDKKAAVVTGFDARFDVGPLAPGGAYVLDTNSTKLSVTTVGTPMAGWNTAAAIGVPGPFNGTAFFMSAGDPNGQVGVAGNATEQPPFVMGTFVLHKDAADAGDLYVVFRVFDPLPAVYNGPNAWLDDFGEATINGSQQYEIGRGNPGFSRPGDDPAYASSETLQPLIIHQVPEPGALALLVLGGLAVVRRRK